MTPQKTFADIEERFDEVVSQSTPEGTQLFQQLVTVHHADIAQFLAGLSHEQFDTLFACFPAQKQLDIFEHLSNSLRARALAVVNDQQRLLFLEHMSMDDISDLIDFANEDKLKKYFNLLHHKDREKVLALLKLEPDSVGAAMDINVVSLHEQLTVAKSIQILQSLKPQQELHRVIYITDQHNKLVGYINLQDLVLKSPHTTLASFMKPNELIIPVEAAQDEVAKQMRHYQLTSAPVVSKDNQFLGAITDETLVDILQEEASEDILRISAMAPIKHTYFETPFFRMFLIRSAMLVVLMLVESLSSTIQSHYETILVGCGLFLFSPMLISTGGNTSTQTSAVVVQGLATGELNSSNTKRFLRRELVMAACLALVLGIVAFLRVYFWGHTIGPDSSETLTKGLAVGASISVVVLTSVALGSSVPFILKKIGLDPAFAAAPFLATGMDILGLLLYCLVSQIILR